MKNNNAYNLLNDNLKNNKNIYLFISLLNENGLKIGDKFIFNENWQILYSDNTEKTNAVFENLKELPSTQLGKININIKNQKHSFYFEMFSAPPRIIIFGGGHIGKFLAELASKFDFNILVIDDRKDLLDKISSKKTETLCIQFNQINKHLTLKEDDYLVIVTRGHMYDKDVLEQVISAKVKYIGMLGSKKRVLAVKQLLLKQGIPQKEIDKLYSPIGLPFSSNSVEEIVLSIFSEIIAVKNNKIGKFK